MDTPNSRQRLRPICRCLLWTLGIPIGAFFAYTTSFYVLELVNELRFPHNSLYNTKLGAESKVIGPLISDTQTFDIAVTVWATRPSENKIPVPRYRRIQNEYPLFSNIVFRGLQLHQKHASTIVKFRLPTSSFRNAALTESSLRASFVLMPTTPSSIDHIKGFTSWMPDSVFAKRPPSRAWPFPLGSQNSARRSLADEALDSFSISVPLLEFHDSASRCPAGSNGEHGPSVANHPHVVTRTQLRIIRETGFFNAAAYNAVRNEIRLHSCGQGIPVIG
ncbi:Proteophosphoglycan 5 [Mycena indigotica]|uniref:Proteophosphoglycan 5 n=1 Tax=Mycena indigotica TaxID=2126181 RepID=A0A8H6VVG7_9AGAR|nr:Proteophosphoglycan 5 [Mycena indigotica]KAF7295454.1 Proteophosphoglycan 5 [Mycena indigotica]